MKVVIILTIIKPEIGPGFFDDLGSEDMSIFKAFNELIANSIDSWIQKGKTKTCPAEKDLSSWEVRAGPKQNNFSKLLLEITPILIILISRFLPTRN